MLGCIFICSDSEEVPRELCWQRQQCLLTQPSNITTRAASLFEHDSQKTHGRRKSCVPKNFPTSHWHHGDPVETTCKFKLSPQFDLGSVCAVVSAQIRGNLSTCLYVLPWQPP